MDKVIVYSSDTCPYCTAVKNFLDENKVEYEVKNVSHDTEARNELIEKGYRGVPVTVIGDEEVVGFDQAKLVKLLNL